MNNFDNPIEFNTSINYGDVKVEYNDIMEIGQGCPIIGVLSINNKRLNGMYGGPSLFNSGYLYVPVFIRNFLGSGFKLSRINIATNHIEYLTATKDLIYIDKIEGDKIFYYEDINKTKISFSKINIDLTP